MSDKKLLARHLYITQGKTQKEIAQAIGVSERTIYTWIHQYAWQKLKLAAHQAPATIADNLCSQLVEMQQDIASRPPGKRYPTQQEAEITRKLIMSIEGMKKSQSLAANMQTMESFRDFVRPLNSRFSKELAHYANRFLTTKSQAGYAPYQLEYGIEQFAAMAPFYDELEADEPCDAETPPVEIPLCIDIEHCLNPVSGCRHPKCHREELNIISDPPGNREADEPWAPLPTPIPPMPEETPEILTKPEIFPETLTSKGIEPLPVPHPAPEETGRKPAIPEVNSNKEIAGKNRIIHMPPPSAPPASAPINNKNRMMIGRIKPPPHK